MIYGTVIATKGKSLRNGVNLTETGDFEAPALSQEWSVCYYHWRRHHWYSLSPTTFAIDRADFLPLAHCPVPRDVQQYQGRSRQDRILETSRWIQHEASWGTTYQNEAIWQLVVDLYKPGQHTWNRTRWLAISAAKDADSTTVHEPALPCPP